MQQDCNWQLGKIAFSVGLENTGKNRRVKIEFKSKVKVIIFLRKKQDTKKKKKNNKSKKFEHKMASDKNMASNT